MLTPNWLHQLGSVPSPFLAAHSSISSRTLDNQDIFLKLRDSAAQKLVDLQQSKNKVKRVYFNNQLQAVLMLRLDSRSRIGWNQIDSRRLN